MIGKPRHCRGDLKRFDRAHRIRIISEYPDFNRPNSQVIQKSEEHSLSLKNRAVACPLRAHLKRPFEGLTY